ncbi:hypothetical protein Tco_0529858 [Tanacetum coccineum]
MTKSKSFNKSPKQRALYHALMESILEDEDAIDEGVANKLKKRKQDDADKEKGPFAGSDRGLKRWKTSKDTKPSKKAAPKHNWFKKPERPPTPNSDCNVRKSIDFRPPQTWIIKIAQAEKPPLSFDELMSTPIDFSAYVMNHLKIDKLTQEHLIRPTFNPLKGTCKSHVKLEYNFKKCYKALTDRLDLNKPEGKEYPFDLSKPLPLIMVQGRQVVPVDYFINNDLEYLRGGSSRKKYTTSTTKTKAAKYDIPGIEDMVPSLMRLDELYKFSDGTLTSVRTVLHDIASNLRMDYLPKRRWGNFDRQRSRIMIKAIDKLLLERRLMRSLEKFIEKIERSKEERKEDRVVKQREYRIREVVEEERTKQRVEEESEERRVRRYESERLGEKKKKSRGLVREVEDIRARLKMRRRERREERRVSVEEVEKRSKREEEISEKKKKDEDEEKREDEESRRRRRGEERRERREREDRSKIVEEGEEKRRESSEERKIRLEKDRKEKEREERREEKRREE